MSTTDLLLEWYAQADHEARSAAAWYGRGRRKARAIARRNHVTERTAAGVVAALSPRMTWAKNLEHADVLLAAWARGAGEPPRVGIMTNVRKAWRIAGGERPLDVLGGPKTRAFYRNLTGDLEHVTVDVWAARAAGLPMREGTTLTLRQYESIATAYREAARIVGVRPAELQAIVWTAIRGTSE